MKILNMSEKAVETLKIAIIVAIIPTLGVIYMAHYKERLCFKQNQEIIKSASSNPALAENLLKLVEDCVNIGNKKIK